MKIAIYGYGNLGRGVECAVINSTDAELFGVFTRRAPETVKTVSGCNVYRVDDILKYKDDIDVVIICGGSATDLPKMTPDLAKNFNVVDSFDTHAKIPEHFENVDSVAKKTKHTALISGGWDPGMFSINRLYASAVLPDGKDYTFWGKGVSQGHSDAIRRIDGVKNAKQYTIPINAALDAVRSGSEPQLTTRIENEIVTMPNYFADYDTIVHFITEEELQRDHAGIPHGGFVIRTGKTGINHENSHVIEYSLKLDSNPEFTASVLVAYARAIIKLNNRGDYGCKTVFDIAPADLSSLSNEELRKTIL